MTEIMQWITNSVVMATEIESLNDYLKTKKVNKLHLIGSEKGIDQLLKALIGRNLYDKDAYYPILNLNDQSILKAITVLNNKK